MDIRFKILAICLAILIFLLSGHIHLSGQTAYLNDDEKINGMSFLGPESPGLDLEMFDGIKMTHSNWVALIPEAILDRETLTLKHDSINYRWGETIAAQIDAIQLSKRAGLKIMLKPHIVLEKKSK